ncbi:MAG: inorganic triphosphatase [Chloroflexaceae bacterium]
MEIEAKFRIDAPDAFTQLPQLDRLGTYTLHPEAESEAQRNTYYDTDDGRLRNARYGLRTREVAGRSVVTLKGPGEVAAGVHRRAEWEFPADTPNPAAWPDAAAREQVCNIIGNAPLVQLLTIETRRRHIYAERDGTRIAEISLDEGTISAGTKTQPFRELEIELLPDGTSDDLDALTAALREHVTLIPEERSKLEQGLALLEQTGS